MRFRHDYRCNWCGDRFPKFGKGWDENSRPNHEFRIAADGMVLAICEGTGEFIKPSD